VATGQWSAQPIASRRPKGAIEAAGASWIIDSEVDGCPLHQSARGRARLIWRKLPSRTARARRAGLAKAEPGAGSAGRGAAQRCRLDLYGHLYPGDMDRYADRLDTAADEASKSKMRPDETWPSQGDEVSGL
jgi:hypothetical protein